jgi:ABC-2 type transport system ATP-binding protein
VREGRLVEVTSVQALLASHWRAVNLVLGSVPAPNAFALPNVRVLAINGQMVHLMIQGEVNELLRRLATFDVRDVSIATPDIEDVFLGFYEGPVPESTQVAAPAGVTH